MISATGCAQSTRVVTETHVEYRDPPEDLLHCPLPKPQPPAHGAIVGAWKVYVILLEQWGEGCREHLEGDKGSVAAWVRAHRALSR